MFFIDESGSIPTTLDTRYKYRYFVISFVHTSDPKGLKNAYNHAYSNLRNSKKTKSFFDAIANPNEMKGSEMPPFMKYYILKHLFAKTDIKIAQMVVDNWNIDQRFRDKPGRSFNYLIKLIIENFPNLTIADKTKLDLKIDNRNTAIKGLKELEGYLYNQLVLDTNIINNVSVEYLESKFHRGIQVADIIAHIIFQRFKYKNMGFPSYNEANDPTKNLSHPYTYEFLYKFIEPRIKTKFIFPPRQDLIDDAAATFLL